MTGWKSRVEDRAARLWARVLAQAQTAGVTVPGKYLDAVPKEVAKFSYFEKICDILLAHDPSEYMTKQKSVTQYVDNVLAPGLGLTKVKGDAGDEKQRGLLRLSRFPAFTPIAQSYQIEDIYKLSVEVADHIRKDLDWAGSVLKEDITEGNPSFGVHGNVNPLFTFGHAGVVGGVTRLPWTREYQGKPQVLPLPSRYYIESWPEQRALVTPPGSYLRPAHCLIGSSAAGGRCIDGHGVVTMKNPKGAAGYPYTGMSNARDKTTDGDRASKANTAQNELEHIVKWVKAGQPWSGPLWDRLAQPATMTTRGDAKVDIDLYVFVVAMLEEGYPLGLMLLSARGIVIVPTIQWILEALYGEPWLQALADNDVRPYDMRTLRHTKTEIRGIMEGVKQKRWRATGTDISRWDMNKYAGEDGLMAATNANLFAPGKVNLLFGAASRPALWSVRQIERLVTTIPVGEYRMESVEVPNKIGEGTHVEKCKVYHLEVDFRKLVVQTQQLTNGSGIRLCGYNIPTLMQRSEVFDELLTYGDVDPENREFFVETHGCIRSGAWSTSKDNSRLNILTRRAAAKALVELGPKSGLVQRAAAAVGLPKVTKVSWKSGKMEALVRGDDAIYADDIEVWFDGVRGTHEQVCTLIISLSGRDANVDKQRSGTDGVPELEFSSVVYDDVHPGGLTPWNRSWERGITTEGGKDVSNLVQRDESEKDLDLGLVTDTLSAKARIMPQRGSSKPTSPMGSPTPGNEFFIETVAAMDKFGLVYGINTDINQETLDAYIEAEAKRFASNEAKKHNLDADAVKELENEYREAELHSYLIELAQRDERRPVPRRSKDGALRSFKSAVKVARTGGDPYIVK